MLDASYTYLSSSARLLLVLLHHVIGFQVPYYKLSNAGAHAAHTEPACFVFCFMPYQSLYASRATETGQLYKGQQRHHCIAAAIPLPMVHLQVTCDGEETETLTAAA